MRNIGTIRFLVAGLLLVLSHPMGGSDVCLADPTDAHPTLSSIPKPSPDVDKAAREGMTMLEKLIENDKGRATALGFDSPDEVTQNKMKLGSGIPVLQIMSDKLPDKSDYTNVFEFLKPMDRFIYPITVDGKVRSSMTVKKLKDTWKAVGYGAKGLVSALEKLDALNVDGVFVAREFEIYKWYLVKIGHDKTYTWYELTRNPKTMRRKYSKDKPKGGPGSAGVEVLQPGVPPAVEAEAGPRPGGVAGEDLTVRKKEVMSILTTKEMKNGPTVLRNLAEMYKKRKPDVDP